MARRPVQGEDDGPIIRVYGAAQQPPPAEEEIEEKARTYETKVIQPTSSSTKLGADTSKDKISAASDDKPATKGSDSTDSGAASKGSAAKS